MYQPKVLFIIPLIITVVVSFPTNSNNIDPGIPIDFSDLMPISNNTELIVVEVGVNLRYTFGKRVKYDRLVSQHSDRSYWPSPQNVTLILQYPDKGQNTILTFVEVIVNQSSNIGAARVIAGGIGKRYIATIIEGNRTYWFDYSASIYGI